MVFFEKVDEDKYLLIPEFPSWYKMRKYVNEQQFLYLQTLQNVFKVKNTNGEWIPYRLTNHQVEYHLEDVVIAKNNTKSTVVMKSRGTSFTVSTVIRMLMAVSEYNNKIIPVTKLTGDRAVDLISDIKDIIKHITPIKYEVMDKATQTKKVLYMPFNPLSVDINNVKTIKFPNGTVWKAFPAKADASELIRGERTYGYAGIIDESNFMRYFKDIYIAMRDSFAGSVDGNRVHQVNIGSTLKGITPFSVWLDKVKVNVKQLGMIVFDWPVFNRDEFQEYLEGKCDVPFYENDKLVSIVPWHNKQNLWQLWQEDKFTFLEEYMAIRVDSNEQFYESKLVIEKAQLQAIDLDELYRSCNQYDEIRIGIDPASINDIFAISVIGVKNDVCKELLVISRYKETLPDSLRFCTEMIKNIIIELGEKDKLLVSIDSTPIGLHLTQALQEKFGYIVRGVNGNQKVKTMTGTAYKLNEYGHIFMKKMMQANKYYLIDDENHISHFLMINREFKIMKIGDAKMKALDELGHADTCMSSLYAMLPRNLDYAGSVEIDAVTENDVNNKDFNFDTFADKIKYYKKFDKKKGGVIGF